jgi:hypothetical protein
MLNFIFRALSFRSTWVRLAKAKAPLVSRSFILAQHVLYLAIYMYSAPVSTSVHAVFGRRLERAETELFRDRRISARACLLVSRWAAPTAPALCRKSRVLSAQTAGVGVGLSTAGVDGMPWCSTADHEGDEDGAGAGAGAGACAGAGVDGVPWWCSTTDHEGDEDRSGEESVWLETQDALSSEFGLEAASCLDGESNSETCCD